MWETIITLLYNAVSSVFGWFTTILNSIPGSWDSYFTVFIIYISVRFLLKPFLGFQFSAGSDKAKTTSNGKTPQLNGPSDQKLLNQVILCNTCFI